MTKEPAEPDGDDDSDGAADPAGGPPPAACEIRPGRTWKVTLSYDGTDYVGWERQKNGLAVQEVVEDALFRLTGERIVVIGSGRTDAGVHAEGQAASFRMVRPMPARKLRLAMNALLPRDIAVLKCEEAHDAFHARFDAAGKTYRYTLVNGPVRRPLDGPCVFHFPQRLNAEAMHRAAQALVGTHDFRALAKQAWRKRNCVRTIFGATVSAAPLDPETCRLVVEISGSGFLYNMVRIVVGTLIDVGLGRRPESCFTDILAAKARAAAGFTVPPCGLCLVGVSYPPPP